MKKNQFTSFCLILFLLSGCQSNAAIPEPELSTSVPTVVSTVMPESVAPHKTGPTTPVSPTYAPAVSAVLEVATPDSRLTPKYWREWPVVPTLSDRARAILRNGIQMGNDIHSFARIGDCQSEPPVFLGIYGTDRYKLPSKYPTLPETIEFFQPSFERVNVTARQGFGVSNVLSNLFSDPKMCQQGETPVDCELRRNKPIVAFIAMGTNWQPNSSAKFELYLRQITDHLIKAGTLPIIVTKPDNIEGDWLLDRAMGQVAYDYDLPLVNVWRALDYLPGHGLDKDLTYMVPAAWDERNLAALRTLDLIRQEITLLSENSQP
ncbi:MAG TPA: SGNH/GDSL hydrolase family protein [Anaerolineales bacterium]|nr:SGNH/GDSL hydrolase family protein [Anaerolineales bacterium]